MTFLQALFAAYDCFFHRSFAIIAFDCIISLFHQAAAIDLLAFIASSLFSDLLQGGEHEERLLVYPLNYAAALFDLRTFVCIAASDCVTERVTSFIKFVSSTGFRSN